MSDRTNTVMIAEVCDIYLPSISYTGYQMEKDKAWFSSQKRWHAPWTEDLLIHRQPGGVGRLGAPVKETPRNLFFLYCLFTFKKPSFYMKKNPPTSVPNFNTLVKDLVHKDLLTSTFTQAYGDRGMNTWRLSRVSDQNLACLPPLCVFCRKK
jgi:hypothetical protein